MNISQTQHKQSATNIFIQNQSLKHMNDKRVFIANTLFQAMYQDVI